jgi:hypothetical protein
MCGVIAVVNSQYNNPPISLPTPKLSSNLLLPHNWIPLKLRHPSNLTSPQYYNTLFNTHHSQQLISQTPSILTTMTERALLTHLAIFNIVIACSNDQETIPTIRAKILTVHRANLSSDFVEALRTLGRQDDGWKIYKAILLFRGGDEQSVMWRKFECRDGIKKTLGVDVEVKSISVVLREAGTVAGMVVDEGRMEM